MFNKKCFCDEQTPIMEPMINNCVEKEIYHEVKHCCPINTHVINKHIFNHIYTPMYTCTSEDVIVNIDNGCCMKFMGK